MIDPTFKNELMDALGTAVSTYNHNADPNAAVVKAARDHHFNVEQTKRLVETFNTARTLYQYERGEKSAHFPLADQAAVLYAMFQSELPATQKAASLADYSEYDRPETMAKHGHVATEVGELPGLSDSDVHGMTIEKQAERAYKMINSQRRAADHALDVGRQVSLAADQAFHKLAAWLRYLPHEEAVDKYARLKAAYQDDATLGPILKRAHGWVPQALQPMGGRAEGLGAVIDDRDLTPAVAALKEAQELIEQSCNMQALGEQLHKDASAFEQEFVGLVVPNTHVAMEDPLSSFFPKRAANAGSGKPQSPAPQNQQPPRSPSPKSDPGPISKFMSKAVESAGTSVASTALEDYQKAMRRPIVAENAKMTERLRNVQRQVILQDLVINDPIISEADQPTIQNAYLAVQQLAPEVTANKEVMRAILRHAIHSVAISPYDASSWVELEKLIQDVRGTRPGQQNADAGKGKK